MGKNLPPVQKTVARLLYYDAPSHGSLIFLQQPVLVNLVANL